MATSSNADADLTPAQRMAAMHDTLHQPTIEDVVDESETPVPPPAPIAKPQEPTSAKVAGKQKAPPESAPKPTKAPIDTASEELFPSLGASKTKAPSSTWGTPPASVVNGSKPRSNGATPTVTMPSMTGYGQPRGVNIPGTVKDSFTLQQSQMKSRSDLRKPLPDLIRDINKNSRAKVEMRGAGNAIVFLGSGPTQESVREALKDVVNQVGARQTLKLPIPASVRPFIIGKGGATIKSISERTGARVQLPKATGPENDDDVVEVEIEGNPIATQYARHQIESIIKERTATLSQRLRHIPAEFYPFIAGPHNSGISALEDGRDVRVKVPHYYTWSSQPPAEQATAFAPHDSQHIQLSGDREAVRQVQEAIEEQVRQLQRQLTLNRLAVERERHRFILGQAGQELHSFLEETGCSLILPPAHEPDTEDIIIIGPADQIETATNKVIELASSMQMATIDVAKAHANAARGAQAHARDVTRYLQQRKALADFEKMYDAQIVTPSQHEIHTPWQIYARDGKSTMKARSDLLNLVAGHPPSRFRNLEVHPYFHEEVNSRHAQHLKEQFGVHTLAPEDEQPLLLVFEGPGSQSSYSFPRSRPTDAEVAEFQKALEEAEAYIQALVQGQSEIVQKSVDAPSKYREKIQRHAARELQREPSSSYPVQFIDSPRTSGGNYSVTFRGPADAVDAYAASLAAFIEEQIRDEAERGYVTTMDFPQKYANLLIGRRGESINKLRDEFDVEVKVSDGIVSIQGPQAKAEKAKAHIASLSRKFEDETSLHLKIKPQFHRELVGPKGATVMRLQDRYGVRIQFPRSGASDDQSVADGASEAGPKGRGVGQAPDEVVIKGPSRGADQARDELLSLFQYLQENSHTATVNVAQALLPSLIGQGGKELDALRLNTGAVIDIPPRDEVSSTGRVDVKLKGSKKAVEAATKELKSRSEAFDSTVSRSMAIDSKHHQFLIGARGDNLKKLITEAGGAEDARRLVQFPRGGASEPDLVKFEGQEDVVSRLMQSLQLLVEQRDQQVTEAIEVAPGKHGKLIGRQGLVRRGLETDFEIELGIPGQNVTGPERSQIKITGLPENVQKAKTKILDMTKEQEGSTMEVPVRLHHAIIDSGPNFFKNLSNNHRVTVDHAGQQRPPRPQAPTARINAGIPLITDDVDAEAVDVASQHSFNIQESVATAQAGEATIPWVLKGPDAAGIEKVRLLIEQAMRNAEDSVTGYLVLPDQRMHRLVIGQGGATINKIRKQTGCKIDVPKNSGAVEPIEIVGTRENVEKAKGLVIEAVIKGSQK